MNVGKLLAQALFLLSIEGELVIRKIQMFCCYVGPLSVEGEGDKVCLLVFLGHTLCEIVALPLSAVGLGGATEEVDPAVGVALQVVHFLPGEFAKGLELCNSLLGGIDSVARGRLVSGQSFDQFECGQSVGGKILVTGVL